LICSNCAVCGREIRDTDDYAELNLTLWNRRGDTARRETLVAVCRFCTADAELEEAGRPCAKVVALGRHLLVHDRVEPAEASARRFDLDSYEPETGVTDDGLELPGPEPLPDKNRHNLH